MWNLMIWSGQTTGITGRALDFYYSFCVLGDGRGTRIKK